MPNFVFDCYTLKTFIMKKIALLLVCVVTMLMATSCHTYRHNMREPNVRFEFNSNDIELSSQLTAEAVVTRVLGIDWQRLFGKVEVGTTPFTAEIPIIGSFVTTGANYALYKLMQENPGYDVVVYPQVESYRKAPVLGTDLFSKTTYKVTARLGKLKK